MKKQIILAGAACGLLAVLPAVGAFAATATDTVNVTVNSGCNVAANRANGTVNATANLGSVNPGSSANGSSTAITITCNNKWKVTPTLTTALTSAGGTAITSTDNGKGSTLMLKIATGNTASSNGGTITNGFNGTSGNAINGTTSVSGTAAANAVTLTPTYYITIGQTQEPGTYTGTVNYDIAIDNN